MATIVQLADLGGATGWTGPVDPNAHRQIASRCRNEILARLHSVSQDGREAFGKFAASLMVRTGEVKLYPERLKWGNWDQDPLWPCFTRAAVDDSGSAVSSSAASRSSSGGAPPQGPLELQNMPARDEPAHRPKDDEVPVVHVDAEYSGKNCIGITVARRYWTDSRHLTITAELRVRNICGVPIHTHVMVKREGLSHLEEIMQMGSDVLPPGSHGWVGPLPALGFAPVYPGTDFLLANSVVDATERAERDKSGNWWIHFATASCDAFDKNGHLTAAFRDAELYHIECPTIPAF